MSAPDEQWESTLAWRELLAALGDIDRAFLEGPRAVRSGQAVADGYRTLAMLLGVAWDTYLFAEPSRPVFAEVNTPFRRDRRWGGDNTDAWYCFTPVDPRRTYRISGQRGTSAYFSLTVYNEPSPGAWSDRVVGVVRDEDLDLDESGRFSLVIGPRRPEGYAGTFLELSEDAAVAFTRDYQVDPLTATPVTWEIEALDEPDPIRHGDEETAESLRSGLRWLQTMFAILPLTIGVRSEDEHTLGHEVSQVANEFAEPYRVPDVNFGWSATDACYSFGSFVLRPDEALVVTHHPPACRFWNLTVWNQFMSTHNAADGRSSVNHGTARPNADGSVTVVIARDLLPHPNAITTMDYPEGNLAFRWFLADEVPARPEVRLVTVSEAPTALT
jgi:hypothetical protein